MQMTTRQSGREGTLHERIRGDIEDHILSGRWAPGDRIPFEVELAAQYGCSRMTVNKVLTQLARAGLLARRRRSGTFVLEPRAQAAVLEIHDIEAEVRSLRQPYAYQLLARAFRRARDDDEMRLEDLSPGGPLIEIEALHFAGAKPFCLEERLINAANVPEAIEADFAAASAGRWLLGQVPWTKAEHRIQAGAADAATARALRIAAGTACLVVERRTFDAKGSVTHVRLTYPGDRHRLVATFTPAG